MLYKVISRQQFCLLPGHFTRGGIGCRSFFPWAVHCPHRWTVPQTVEFQACPEFWRQHSPARAGFTTCTGSTQRSEPNLQDDWCCQCDRLTPCFCGWPLWHFLSQPLLESPLLPLVHIVLGWRELFFFLPTNQKTAL